MTFVGRQRFGAVLAVLWLTVCGTYASPSSPAKQRKAATGPAKQNKGPSLGSTGTTAKHQVKRNLINDERKAATTGTIKQIKVPSGTTAKHEIKRNLNNDKKKATTAGTMKQNKAPTGTTVKYEVKRNLASDVQKAATETTAKHEDKRILFNDDERFWSRFVQQVVSSSLTEAPSAAPSPAPSPSPSEAPTDFCEAEAFISCTDQNGVDCKDIQQPEGQCAIGDNIQIIRFKLEFCTCDESRNTQPGFDMDKCLDSGALPSGDETVRVTCTAPDGSLLFSSNVQANDEITLSQDPTLPEEVTCSVFSTSGSELQTVTINTSGNVDLYLMDKYGSFVLLACDASDCIADITYSYTAENTGPTTLTVTKFERTRNGESKDLLPDLIPTVIPPASSGSASETESINICMDGAWVTTLSVEAFPPTGLVCPAQDVYEFDLQVGCRVDVEIECKSVDGIECSELQPPELSCTLTDGDIDTLKFQYVTCTCDESKNTQDGTTCTDFAPLPVGAVDIVCVDAASGSALSLNPGSVMPGDTLVMTSTGGATVPEEVKCTISDGSTVVQEFTFFTAGGQELALEDKFGSFTLLACDDQDCEVLLCYTYDIENVGTNDMDLTLLERTRNDETESLYDLLDVTFLRPGEETSVEEKEVIDLCIDASYLTTVVVEADPPNGITCLDEDEYIFETEVGCKVDVEIECMAEDGTECKDLPPRNGTDCLVVLCYEYDIENVGTNVMDLTLLERTRNNETVSLLGELDVTALAPGESTSVTEKETVDLCVEAEYTTTVSVAADPPNGITCFDDDEYTFEVTPPCDINVEMVCNIVGDGPVGGGSVGGDVCEELVGEQFPECDCSDDCARELIYRYTAAACAPGSPGCSDSGANELTADILISSGGTTFFQGQVQVGDDIVIQNGGACIPDDMEATVSPAGSSSSSQTVSIISSCGGAVTLLDVFGALEFAGYTCEDNTPHDCYVDVEYTIETCNAGQVTQVVTDWVFELNGETKAPGLPLPTLDPTECFTAFEPAEVNRCDTIQYSATVEVEGNGLTNPEVCESTDQLTFDLTPGSPFPSPSPSEAPSSAPSASPSAAPSPSPSAPPSSAPSAPPSPSPSAPPSPAPSAAPSPAPSPAPSAPPSPAPSEAPSPAPSAFPTPEEPCVFDLDIVCIPPPGTPDCNATPPPVEQCQGRPFEMVFLYNGGNCDQSFNVQAADGKFFCTDFEGGPPTEQGELSYIVVTDLDGEVFFHQDFVAVGSLFTLSDGGNNFPANQLITIYKNDNTADPANILQSIQYHSSCSSNLFLKDRFGATQLVIWVNEVQGTISCFANQTFELDITVPIDIEGGPAVIQSLTVASNVDPFFFNLTDKVFGVEVDAGDTLQASLNIPIDLTKRTTYNLLITLSALTQTGKECRATELTSFTAGYPLPPIFPTFSPTQAPTGTAAPTRDPETAPCRIDANINCQSGSGKNCRRLSAPTSTVCDSEDERVRAVEFLYTGTGLSTSEVYIDAQGKDAVAFQGVVQQGEIFTMTQGLEKEVDIIIYSVSNGGPGTVLAEIEKLKMSCSGEVGKDLTLLTNYGPLQLVGFTNTDQGQQSIIETFTITWTIANEGPPATVTSAIALDPFQPAPVELVGPSNPLSLPRGGQETVETFATLNLAQNAGTEYQFELSIAGSSDINGRPCSDAKSYTISVE